MILKRLLETMYEDLLNHNKLGNRSELIFFLFDILKPGIVQRQKDLHTFATGHNFSIAQSFYGIIHLLEFMSLIKINDDMVIPNSTILEHIQAQPKKDYFLKDHFFKLLIDKLIEVDGLYEVFNEDNIKFQSDKCLYYIEDVMLPLRLSPLKNLLLQTGFLYSDPNLPNHLYVNENFTVFFKHIILQNIQASKKARKRSLESLKKDLERKEELGRQAEIFVLGYEKERLNKHPEHNKIQRISDEYVNAGYDIESYEDKDSVFYDRFIEVKSYDGNNISFHWSKNEIEYAKELKDKYFIYLVDRSRINDPEYSPIMYQNPYKKIYNNDLWGQEADSWHMTLLVDD